ncbi:MAG: hypothetical protein M3Q42_08505 [Pseudomonadota bacterium]|nr:hypothetical protein [Pseudomonadota bacterium]
MIWRGRSAAQASRAGPRIVAAPSEYAPLLVQRDHVCSTRNQHAVQGRDSRRCVRWQHRICRRTQGEVPEYDADQDRSDKQSLHVVT